MAAQYWGLLVNFAFLLHSVWWLSLQMPPTLAASFFLPGIISKSPALGISQLLSSSPLPTFQWPWEHRPEKWPVQSSENCEHYPYPSDSAWGQRLMGKWCCGRNFYLQTRLFPPCTPPLSQPLRGENAEEGWLAGSDPKLLFGLSLPQPLAHPGVLPCVGVAAYCFSTRPT